MKPDTKVMERMARAALEEDGAFADATVRMLAIGSAEIWAEALLGADATIAGIDLARACFAAAEPRIRFDARYDDGATAPAGGVVFRVDGPGGAVLAAERAALNCLQHLCGVATMTARFVAAVAGTGVTVLDTRKTTPLWREFDKYAVRCGGGRNHRRDLSAMVLIKENHIRAAGGMDKVLASVGSRAGQFVEIEVDSLELLDQVLGHRVDRVMLDNFSPAEVTDALSRIRSFRRTADHGAPEVEVSGGITLETIRSYALPGVDYISIGALTHSAPATPISLEVVGR